jgi:hypothetical protein
MGIFLKEKSLLRDILTSFSICVQKINGQMMMNRSVSFDPI